MGEDGQQLAKLRAVGGGAGDLLAEHLLAPCRLELGDVGAEVLGLGGDAGVAVNHASQYASKKPNTINALVLMHKS